MLNFKNEKAFFSWQALTPNKPEIGEIAYIEDKDMNYQYMGSNLWNPMEKSKQEVNTGVTLYDLNKSIISQLTPMANEEQVALIDNYFGNPTPYCMLLCRDINYYSIFIHDENSRWVHDFSSLGEAVITCLNEDFGQVILTDTKSSPGAIEIWVKNNEDTLLFMLFNCGPLIIPYGEE